MKILLDNSPQVIEQKSIRFSCDFWQLRTPLTRNRIGDKPYALDNGCFTGKLHPSYWRMLDEAEECRPIFVALPDVVGNARRTLDLFEHFHHRTQDMPRALVLQDGIDQVPIPWAELDAVFVGGTDQFKISKECHDAVRTAKLLDKWIHVGRVNSWQRALGFADVADSIDGSGIAKFDRWMMALLNGTSLQQSLCLDGASDTDTED